MPSDRTIFVFGSNMAGRHGAGSALEAVKHWGAEYGRGVGLQGSSYAIPTKDMALKPLPLPSIRLYIKTFLTFARNAPGWEFKVVKIGCGLAGYSEEQIKPMFAGAPVNCVLPSGWRD